MLVHCEKIDHKGHRIEDFLDIAPRRTQIVLKDNLDWLGKKYRLIAGKLMIVMRVTVGRVTKLIVSFRNEFGKMVMRTVPLNACAYIIL